MTGACRPTPNTLIRCGDRVWATYREHSIPTRSPGTVVGVGVRFVTVKLDPPVTLEAGDRVCVPWQDVVPLVAGEARGEHDA